ncbi:type II toxin-antitoxin system RelE family toxin [Saccharopolyspora sp. 5N708]|uniref:type II toxin-antitoxin system RelE family toxin n=1 Tax=Saccharopolyspora sp. 5N708 TaxID=3457424 RepID=UPI003FD2A2E9
MTYPIKITARAERDLARLPEKVATACVEFIFGPLAENPHQLGKPLFAEFKGLHSTHRSSYRVVYAIQDDTVVVEVVRIAYRADVYR